MPDPKIVTIALRITAAGLIIAPDKFAKLRNEIDVVRFTNTSNLPGPRPVIVELEVPQAKTLFETVQMIPVAPAPLPPATPVASLTTPRHRVTLQEGESVDWIMPTNLPDSGTLPNAPAGGKRRSFRLRTAPAHFGSGDHNDYHVDC